MCEFHDSNCNGFGDMWWTDKCIYFSSIGETASGQKGAVLTPVTADRSSAISENGNGHSGDRLSQTGEKQQLKTATTRVYTYTD